MMMMMMMIMVVIVMMDCQQVRELETEGMCHDVNVTKSLSKCSSENHERGNLRPYSQTFPLFLAGASGSF